MSVLLGFVITIVVIVSFHEFGHYLFAKLFKVRVEVFSVGIGKVLYSKKDSSGTIWQLALLPLGGYVKLAEGKSDKNDTYDSKPALQKIIILFAGPFASVVLGWLMFLIVSFTYGTPVPAKYSEVGIGKVIQGSPAQKSGLEKGDVIFSVITENKNYEINDFKDLFESVQSSNGKQITLLLKRNNQTKQVELTPIKPADTSQNRYQIGVMQADFVYQGLSLFDSFSRANQTTYKALVLVTTGMAKMFAGKVSINDIGGPVKIAEMSGEAADRGVMELMLFIAILSINLAILNLLPIPVLDGGRIVLVAFEKIIGRPIPENINRAIMVGSVVFLLIVFVLITIKDLFSIM